MELADLLAREGYAPKDVPALLSWARARARVLLQDLDPESPVGALLDSPQRHVPKASSSAGEREREDEGGGDDDIPADLRRAVTAATSSQPQPAAPVVDDDPDSGLGGFARFQSILKLNRPYPYRHHDPVADERPTLARSFALAAQREVDLHNASQPSPPADLSATLPLAAALGIGGEESGALVLGIPDEDASESSGLSDLFDPDAGPDVVESPPSTPPPRPASGPRPRAGALGFVDDDDELPGLGRGALVDDDDAAPPVRHALVDDDDVPSPPVHGALVDDDEAPPVHRALVDDDDVSTAPQRGALIDDDDAPPRSALIDDDDAPQRSALIDDDDAPQRSALVDDDDAPQRGALIDDDDAPQRGALIDDDDEAAALSLMDDDDAPPSPSPPSTVSSPMSSDDTIAEPVRTRDTPPMPGLPAIDVDPGSGAPVLRHRTPKKKVVELRAPVSKPRAGGNAAKIGPKAPPAPKPPPARKPPPPPPPPRRAAPVEDDIQELSRVELIEDLPPYLRDDDE